MLNFFRKVKEEPIDADWELAENPVLPEEKKETFEDLVQDIQDKLQELNMMMDRLKNEKHNKDI